MKTSAAAEERVVEERGGGALLQETARERRWWKEEERAKASRPPSPLLIASRGEAGEAGRGGDVGLTAPIPPTHRDYCALMAGRNCRKETCGRFWAAENPRLGPGVDVAGPRPAATSRRARGLAGFLAKGGHVVRRRQVAGPRPGARTGELPPTDSGVFDQGGTPKQSRLPAADLSR